MIHTFKLNGIRAAVDSRDGSVMLLDELAYRMIPEMPEEPTAEMPTSLRYALAKYDSKDLSAAYADLYSLFTSKKEPYQAEGVSSVTVTVRENGSLPVSTVDAPVVCLDCRNAATFTQETIRSIQAEKILINAPFEIIQGLENPESFEKVIIATSIPALDDDNLLNYAKTNRNAVISFPFSESDDLTDTVMMLLDQGIHSVSAYPSGEVGVNTACEKYEKLSRELLRYRKKGGTGVFTPFTLAFYSVSQKGTHICIEQDGSSRSADSLFRGEFTEYYAHAGLIAHLTDAIPSVEIINKCVECAICLSSAVL